MKSGLEALGIERDLIGTSLQAVPKFEIDPAKVQIEMVLDQLRKLMQNGALWTFNQHRDVIHEFRDADGCVHSRLFSPTTYTLTVNV